jgi:predicted Zn-dependent protease with MMP-like domain
MEEDGMASETSGLNGHGPDWSALAAPSLADFETLAEAAYAVLPEHFRKLCADLVIQVDDFPDDDTLDLMECETEFDLLGLFQGRGLAQGGASSMTGQMPNMIWLYRRPILDFWAEHEERLGTIVTHVLVHEIGHHFGLSDDDMHAIEQG